MEINFYIRALLYWILNIENRSAYIQSLTCVRVFASLYFRHALIKEMLKHLKHLGCNR